MDEDYTFVSLDGEEAFMNDAVIIDMDDNDVVSDFVMFDEVNDSSDFITLNDDPADLSADIDHIDTFISDIDEADISFIV